MTIYKNIDDVPNDYDVWSTNGEDFYYNCPRECYDDVVGDSEPGETTVKITGGKLKPLEWEQLVKPSDLLESADDQYYEVLRDDASLFDYFPREFIEKWEKEFEKLILDKFKELDLKKAHQHVYDLKEFEIMGDE